MADRNASFNDGMVSDDDKHATDLIGIIGDDSQSLESKISSIQDHPTLPGTWKNKGINHLANRFGRERVLRIANGGIIPDASAVFNDGSESGTQRTEGSGDQEIKVRKLIHPRNGQTTIDNDEFMAKPWVHWRTSATLHPNMRPDLPHKTFNAYEESSVNLTPHQEAQNAEAELEQKHFDTKYAAQQVDAALRSNGVDPNSLRDGGTQEKAELTPEERRNRRRPVTGPTRSPIMGTREFSQTLEQAHQALVSAAHSVSSLRESEPIASALSDFALPHLHTALKLKQQGDELMAQKKTTAASQMYVQSLNSLTEGHDLLATEHVKSAAARSSLAYELPSTHLTNLAAATATLNLPKPARPHKFVSIAGSKRDPFEFDLSTVARLIGTDNAVYRKISRGQTGTRDSSTYDDRSADPRAKASATRVVEADGRREGPVFSANIPSTPNDRIIRDIPEGRTSGFKAGQSVGETPKSPLTPTRVRTTGVTLTDKSGKPITTSEGKPIMAPGTASAAGPEVVVPRSPFRPGKEPERGPSGPRFPFGNLEAVDDILAQQDASLNVQAQRKAIESVTTGTGAAAELEGRRAGVNARLGRPNRPTKPREIVDYGPSRESRREKLMSEFSQQELNAKALSGEVF